MQKRPRSQRPRPSVYQSVTPANNMVLKRKWDQNIYEVHRRKVQNAKAVIDNHPPASYVHLQVNLKKLQTIKERNAIIERDNRNLLEKMSNITGRPASNTKYRVYKSLNMTQRQKNLWRVRNENQVILKRLQCKESPYNHLQWLDEWRAHNHYMTNISKYPHTWIRDIKVEIGY